MGNMGNKGAPRSFLLQCALALASFVIERGSSRQDVRSTARRPTCVPNQEGREEAQQEFESSRAQLQLELPTLKDPSGMPPSYTRVAGLLCSLYLSLSSRCSGLNCLVAVPLLVLIVLSYPTEVQQIDSSPQDWVKPGFSSPYDLTPRLLVSRRPSMRAGMPLGFCFASH